MSTVSAPPAGLVDPAVDPAADVGEELRVYGHNKFSTGGRSGLGFLFAALTYADGHVMAVVPEGTQVEQARVVPGDSSPHVLVAPPGQAVTAQIQKAATTNRTCASRPITTTAWFSSARSYS